ncbi:armadillo-type protein [Pisolithus microcarpus]|nr:armadillo-type protein [Pisolithus microcarpus]
MDEIRKEVESKDMELKAGAVMKLTYLNMLGYDMNWASFHIIEGMSSSKIHLEIKVAITLNGLSSIVTPDLARDLGPEVFNVLSHSHPHIPGRAPEALPQGYHPIAGRLDDPDPGVISATVNVICELARRNPRDYLPLPPAYFIS